jgi:superfamily II DNA or RNA helicase
MIAPQRKNRRSRTKRNENAPAPVIWNVSTRFGIGLICASMSLAIWTSPGTKPARARLAAVPNGEERLVLATGRYIGEGFDDRRLDTLILAMPVSWKGTLVQYTGRLHRLHPNKSEVRIFDYVDREVPVLLRMFEKRLRTYRAIGYVCGEVSPGTAEIRERTVEYDEEALRILRRRTDSAGRSTRTGDFEWGHSFRLRPYEGRRLQRDR